MRFNVPPKNDHEIEPSFGDNLFPPSPKRVFPTELRHIIRLNSKNIHKVFGFELLENPFEPIRICFLAVFAKPSGAILNLPEEDHRWALAVYPSDQTVW